MFQSVICLCSVCVCACWHVLICDAVCFVIEQQKTKLSDVDGQQGLCGLRHDECKALGRTQTQTEG